MSEIDLNGLDKAEVLAILFNAAKPQGAGFMRYDHTPMTKVKAKELLQRQTYFDYLQGRVMKIDLSGEKLDTWGYDRDNGQGTAERLIVELRKTHELNSSSIQKHHEDGKRSEGEFVKSHLKDDHTVEGNIIRMGLSDIADELGPAVDRAIAKPEKK